jgi:hypothetical protein
MTFVGQFYIVVVRQPTTGDAPGTYYLDSKPAYLNPYTHLLEVKP